MTPIHFALAEVRDRIPEEVLKMTFMPKGRFKRNVNNSSIEYQIIDKVINSRVRRYVDSNGAQEITVPLHTCKQEYIGTQAWTCYIPKELTKGRSITQVISVHISMMNSVGHFGFTGITGSGVSVTQAHQCGTGGMYGQGAKALAQANKSVEINYTPNVYLVSENTIYCEDRMPVSNLELRCMVSSDSEFSFVQGSYVQDFADFCCLAVEAYIYRNQRILLDKASLDGGMDIGAVREVVDGYSDSDEQFREIAKTRWRKMQRLSDKPRSMAYLDLLVTPGM